MTVCGTLFSRSNYHYVQYLCTKHNEASGGSSRSLSGIDKDGTTEWHSARLAGTLYKNLASYPFVVAKRAPQAALAMKISTNPDFKLSV